MKVSLIGLGRVGSAVAFDLLDKRKIKQLALIDIIKDKLEGEYLDLLHAASGKESNIEMKMSSEIEDAKDSDIVVITAGVSRVPDTASRLDLAKTNSKIIKDIIRRLRDVVKEDCKIIMITNPVDVMTYVAFKESGFERRNVFGVGAYLDFFRFRVVDPNAKAILGEHGDSMVFVPETSQESKDYTKEISKRIIELKGGTWWGPAVAITSVLDSIIEDKKDVKIVSAYLEGEYGLNGVCLSVPAKIGSSGIEEIKEIDLTDKEKQSLKNSAAILKNTIEGLQ